MKAAGCDELSEHGGRKMSRAHWPQPSHGETLTFAKPMLVSAANRSSGRAEAIGCDKTDPIEIVGHPTEQLFEQFLELALDAVVIVDKEGRIKRVNRRAEKLFGYSRDELLGREIEVLIPQRWRDRHVAQHMEYAVCPGTRPMGTSLEVFGLRK